MPLPVIPSQLSTLTTVASSSARLASLSVDWGRWTTTGFDSRDTYSSVQCWACVSHGLAASGLAGVAPRHTYQHGVTTEGVVLRTPWPQAAQGAAARRAPSRVRSTSRRARRLVERDAHWSPSPLPAGEREIEREIEIEIERQHRSQLCLYHFPLFCFLHSRAPVPLCLARTATANIVSPCFACLANVRATCARTTPRCTPFDCNVVTRGWSLRVRVEARA
jgi:hypothetical protein